MGFLSEQSGGPLAFVNFNGTGVVSIRKSKNVSSITDNGVGDYTINYTVALPDANYVPMLQGVGVTVGSNVGEVCVIAGTLAAGAVLKTTSQLRIHQGSSNSGVLSDSAEMNAVIFG